MATQKFNKELETQVTIDRNGNFCSNFEKRKYNSLDEIRMKMRSDLTNGHYVRYTAWVTQAKNGVNVFSKHIRNI